MWLLKRLSRVTSSGDFIPEIDGLRFMAIAWVVFHHIKGYTVTYLPEDQRSAAASTLLAVVLDCGKLGVPLFFAISGFILSLPFAKHYLQGAAPISLPKYFRRRILRIEPPYVIHLAIMVLLVFVAARLGRVRTTPSGEVMTAASSMIEHSTASLFYLHNAIYGVSSRLNGVLWSLEIEVQFYIMCPLLAYCLFKCQRPSIRWGLMLLLIGVGSGFGEFLKVYDWKRAQLSLLGQSHFFLVGLLLADIYIMGWERAKASSRWWDVVCLMGWCSLPLLQTMDGLRVAIPFVILLTYLGAFRGMVFNRIFRNSWLVTIGGMCYTIYMYHYPIVSAIGRFTIKASSGLPPTVAMIVQLFLQSAVILPLCAIAFWTFEKPFMYRDWPARTSLMWRRLKTSVARTVRSR